MFFLNIQEPFWEFPDLVRSAAASKDPLRFPHDLPNQKGEIAGIEPVQSWSLLSNCCDSAETWSRFWTSSSNCRVNFTILPGCEKASSIEHHYISRLRESKFDKSIVCEVL